MPWVLDHDSTGEVIGGHFVEELQPNHLLATPDYESQPNPLYEPPHPHRTLPSPFNGSAQHRHAVPNPLYHPPDLQPVFSQIYQAPRRPSTSAQEKVSTFLAMFVKHFKNDAKTMRGFEALFTGYNKGLADETHFYAGIYMLLARTRSRHLLPALVEILPASWQATDLTWLHEAAEVEYDDIISSISSEPSQRTPSDKIDGGFSDALEPNSPDAVERAPLDTVEHIPTLSEETPPPAKRVKKTPSNGFRTTHASASAEVQPMYIDPAALMIHQPVVGMMMDSDQGSETSKSQHKPGRKGLVKLKLNAVKSSRQKSRKVSTKAAVAKGHSLRNSIEMADSIEELETSDKSRLDSPTNHEPSPPAPLSRRGRVPHGHLYAAEIEHFGHFPTRHAVLARASQPYVHLSCGQGYSHPGDVKGHHKNRARTTGGCPGKNGVPRGDDDQWDAHPSTRIGYPDINYTKVKDGYVILDRESAEKIDNAEAAGLKYLAEHKVHERSKKRRKVKGENEEDTEIETAEKSDEMETAGVKSSTRAAGLGPRKRSKKSSS